MNVSDYAGIATLITSTTGGIVAIVIAVRQPKIAAKVDAVHREVATSNGHTIAQIVEAGETRRTDVAGAEPIHPT